MSLTSIQVILQTRNQICNRDISLNRFKMILQTGDQYYARAEISQTSNLKIAQTGDQIARPEISLPRIQ